MTQRRKIISSGPTYLEVIGNEDAGWAEEADQSRFLTGRSLAIGKEIQSLGMDTKLGFTLR
jgi:hypothetical protein